MTFEAFVARRYIRIKHQRKMVPMMTILSTVGVAVGVMVLVVVIAVMSGFQSELKARILGIEAPMVVMRYNDWIADYHQVVSQLETIPGISSVSPFVYAQGILRSADGISGVMLRGIDPVHSAVDMKLQGMRPLAQLLNDNEAPEAGAAELVLGSVLADKLHVKVGGEVILMVSGAQSSALRQLPKMHRLKVVGIFETGMHQYDGAMGFMSLHSLQRLIGVADIVTGMNIFLDDVDNVETVGGQIMTRLGMNYWVSDWKRMHRNLFSMLAMQKVMMFIILTLIIVVAAFNIASALIMMVREKTKDIAILKVMGATQTSLWKIFLGKGLAIGISGIFLGLSGGLILCGLLSKYKFVELPGDVYFLTTMPVQIRTLDLAIIALGTLSICILASWYPAKRAARLNPVDAIRYG
jgi:lipoprotein-releasing system permease protein